MKKILISALLFVFTVFGVIAQNHIDVSEVELEVKELYLWGYVDTSGKPAHELLTTAHLWESLEHWDEYVFYPNGKYVDDNAMILKEHWVGKVPEEMTWEIVTRDSEDYLIRFKGDHKFMHRMIFHEEMLFLLGVDENFREIGLYEVLWMDRFQYEVKRFIKQYEFVSLDDPLPECLWRPVSPKDLVFQVFYPGVRTDPMIFMVEPFNRSIFLIHPHEHELLFYEFVNLMRFLHNQHGK